MSFLIAQNPIDPFLKAINYKLSKLSNRQEQISEQFTRVKLQIHFKSPLGMKNN